MMRFCENTGQQSFGYSKAASVLPGVVTAVGSRSTIAEGGNNDLEGRGLFVGRGALRMRRRAAVFPAMSLPRLPAPERRAARRGRARAATALPLRRGAPQAH